MSSSYKKFWRSGSKTPPPDNGPNPQEVVIGNMASLFVKSLTKANADLLPVLDALVELQMLKLASPEAQDHIVAFISDLTAGLEKTDIAPSARNAIRQAHILLTEITKTGKKIDLGEANSLVERLKVHCPGAEASANDSDASNRRQIFLAALATGSTTLSILKEVSEAASPVVPFLKPIMGGLAGLVGAVHNMALNRDGARSLLDAVGRNILIIAQQCADPRIKSKPLEELIGILQGDLEKIVEECNKLKKKPVFRRIFENKNDENALQGIERALDRALDRFKTSVTLHMYGATQDVDAKTDLILLNQELPNHPEIPRRVNEYYPGSRDTELGIIRAWLDDPQAEVVLWLHGAAGIGKSTLAHRLTQDLRAAHQLAAEVSLGVFLGANKDKTPAELIKTISNGIGKAHLAARWKIVDAIRSGGGLSTELPRLLEQCILEPLRAVFMEDPQVSAPLVVVIDALDEWPENLQLIAALEHLDSHSTTVRFIVLGRHAPPPAPHDVANTRISSYFLGGVETDILKQYLAASLRQVPVPVGGIAFGQTEADALARMAGGVFIWASVALSLITHKYASKTPRQIFEDIIMSKEAVGTGDTRLHVLYRQGMELLFSDPRQQDLLCRYVRLILVLQEPIPLADGAQLLDVPTIGGLEDIRTRLGAFYIRQQLDASSLQPAGTLFHLSFNAYLKGEEWGGEYVAHEMVACACLDKLAKNASATLPAYIIRHWPHHAALGSPSVTPALDDEWKASLVCGTLHSVPLEAVHHWATQFWNIITGNDWDGQVAPLEELMKALACKLNNRDGEIRGHGIPCLEIAVRLRPGDHKVWSQLGQALRIQHTDTGAPGAIARAVVAHQHAKEAGIGKAEDQGALLFALATALHQQAESTSSNAENFFQAIEMHRQALELRPPGHPERSTSLNNLASSLLSRFQVEGDLAILKEAIVLERQALDLQPPGHSAHSTSLNNLASGLWSQFQVEGDLAILKEAIGLYQQALELSLPGHPRRSTSLSNLATSLRFLFQVEGNLAILKEAIALEQQALVLRSPGHPDHSTSLTNLASSLWSQFQVDGDLAILKEAIVLGRQALGLQPPGHPHRGTFLSNLASSLSSQFQVEGDLAILQEAIALGRQALELQPTGHPGRSTSLSSLASSLRSQFQVEGDLAILKEAIALEQQALVLRSPGHQDHSTSLTNLASSLWSQFQVDGDLAILKEAIVLGQQALDLQPPGHPHRGTFLSNLASSLSSQFQVEGDLAILQEAIALGRQALELQPTGHPGRSTSLSSLASSLRSQFQVEGDLAILKEAIALERQALELQPPGHPGRSTSLSSLASSLWSQFQVDRNLAILKEAIALQQQALELQPPGHPDRGTVLSNLASSLCSQFQVDGNLAILREAIALYQQALELRPPGHPDHKFSLENLNRVLKLQSKSDQVVPSSS